MSILLISKKTGNGVQEENRNIGAQLRDASQETSLLAIQGPKSIAAMQPLTDVDLTSLPYYGVQRGYFAGVPTIVATTGYTGAGGIEVYFPNEEALKVWERVLSAGADHHIQPIGLAARETHSDWKWAIVFTVKKSMIRPILLQLDWAGLQSHMLVIWRMPG